MVTDLTAHARSPMLPCSMKQPLRLKQWHCATRLSPARNRFLVADDCHPQTIQVVRTRAKPLGIEVTVTAHSRISSLMTRFLAHWCNIRQPTARFMISTIREDRAHAAGALVVVAADILALTLLKPPGEFGADVAVGSTQRFGVPLGFGGPHAAYFATRDEYKRHMPGRLVGVSHDAEGRPAYRLALQTREQHIRRDKATSNICTAQVLLAVIASMYAVYHGPRGLRAIAQRVHDFAAKLAEGLQPLGFKIAHREFLRHDPGRARPSLRSRFDRTRRATPGATCGN